MVQRGRVERVLGVVNHSGETRWRCGRRCARVRRLGGTRVNSPEPPGNSSGQHRHEPGPPAMLRRMEHALEVPSGAVRGRIAVKVGTQASAAASQAVATKSGHSGPLPCTSSRCRTVPSTQRDGRSESRDTSRQASPRLVWPGPREFRSRRCRRTPLLIVYHGIPPPGLHGYAV